MSTLRTRKANRYTHRGRQSAVRASAVADGHRPVAHEVGVDPVAIQVLRAETVHGLRNQVEGAGTPAEPRNACRVGTHS